MFEFDRELAKRSGAFASSPSDAAPSHMEYYGENPTVEMDRLLDDYATSESNVLAIGCGARHTL